MSEPTAYPLAWPAGWPRTPAAKRLDPSFSRTIHVGDAKKTRAVTVAEARDRLSGQLDRLGARYALLSSNLELRIDGQVRSGAPEPADVGVAIYFQLSGKPIVLACDRWRNCAGNIAAIAAHIGAMRSMDRWGVGSIAQMFTGYGMLPAPLIPEDWRGALDDPRTLEQAEARYREKMKLAHPDTETGSHAKAAALNAAIAQARKELA